MNWNNLKKANCPSCGQALKDIGSGFIGCSRCTFKIREDRLNEIIRFGFQKREITIGDEEEQLQRLNALHNTFRPYS